MKRVAPAVVNVYATERVETRSPFEGDPFFERFFGGGSPFGAPRERERSSLGSGVVVDPTGIVISNAHVVGEASEVKVALADGREYPAEILLRDERTDLAVLKVDNGGEDFPVLDFGDSDALEVGDLVLAVGNPFGVGQTVTSGIVSALARTNLGITDSGFFIQTDAAINPGNSGGALVDMDGALIGINTAIFSRSGGSIGIGFAIPSNMVRSVVAQAIGGSTTVSRPWIGAACQDVTPDIAASLGVDRPRGALVAELDPDSPAEQAGLQVGDLILAAGGRDIADRAGLDYRLAVTGIGNSLDLSVWRDGEIVTLNVAIEAEPELGEGDIILLGGESPLTGASVADLSATLADRLRIRGARSGAVIVEVDAALARGAAWRPARRRCGAGAGRGYRQRRRAFGTGGGGKPPLAHQLQPQWAYFQYRDRGMSTLFEAAGLAEAAPRPLADRLRPTRLDEIAGQPHLLGPEGTLTRMLRTRSLGSLVFWGPPGTGKTTVARLLARETDLHFQQISAIHSGVAELKRIFEEARARRQVGQGTLLFVDEIHRFNRAQQDFFLPVMEDGTVTLVGATTENPSFELNAALLSRATVLVFRAARRRRAGDAPLARRNRRGASAAARR